MDSTVLFVGGMVLGAVLASFLSLIFKQKEMLDISGRNRVIVERLSQGPRVVAIGGGTGLSALLLGLKVFTRNITAIVTVTDEGGSSGRLRTEWGVLPPGDIRNCLVALAENDSSLNRILNFRFDRGELKGHSLGNLIMLAMAEMHGDFSKAIEEMNHLLAIRGRVLPVTNETVSLTGKLKNGERVRGELEISTLGTHISELWLEPGDSSPQEEVLTSLDDADLIVLGPGSLFTSVIPNLLFPEVAKKIMDVQAPKVYVANLMTQPGETEAFTVIDHVNWLATLSGVIPDIIVVNETKIPQKVLDAYFKDNSVPLDLSGEQEAILRKKNIHIIKGNFLDLKNGHTIRHHSVNLAETLIAIIREQGSPLWKS
ncbi:MAG: uridine diphosphate-N-acetylglucosamine-binding protein YvcK [Synergistaceae bacterium]|nr:uridine diphosphate-N-acetylglucosamine-binding protein YvcK [Synergistaceae bacterium]